MTVDVIIPVYHPGEEFQTLLTRLAAQELQPEHIRIINTEEKFWDPKLESLVPGLSVTHIRKEDFDHGTVRHLAACRSQADILVFMTQDAIPADSQLLKNLVRPIMDGKAQMSSARQLPRPDTNLIERFTRSFNYPAESRIKSIEDLPVLGVKTYFCSNVCCAYLHSAYDEAGGFPRPIILNEENILAARVLKKGGKLSYTADACVIHAHNYSAMQQFHRNFDVGVSHSLHPEVFGEIHAEGEGKKLVLQTMKYVCAQGKPHLVCKVVWVSGWKYLGYTFGKHYQKFPKRLVRKWSMHPRFWDHMEEGTKQ